MAPADSLDRAPVADRPTVDVLGVRVHATTLAEFVADVDTALAQRKRLTITFANPNYLMAATESAGLRGLVNAFDRVLTDGWGIMLAARLLRRRIPQRLANDDLVGPLFDLLARRGSRVFFLGSAPGVAEAAADRMSDAFPGLVVAGTMHGFLDVEEGTPGTYSPAAFEQMVAAVNQARADFLIVGIPTPNQQRFVVENLPRLDVPVIMTGGSWIDHLAERVQFYPTLVTKLHLCWAYRWMREPRRLAYRYSVELAKFGWRVLGQRRRGSAARYYRTS